MRRIRACPWAEGDATTIADAQWPEYYRVRGPCGKGAILGLGAITMSNRIGRRSVISVAGLAACIAFWPALEVRAQETIKFGTALSLTGNLATEGKQVREG